MESDKTSTMLAFKSCDGQEFEILETVAIKSQIIRHMIEAECTQNVIPLPNVSGKTFKKVIEYCKWLVEIASLDNSDEEQRKTWEKQFIDVSEETLFDLILAADYLDIKELLDLTCQTVANMIKGKSVEEVREIFHIVNDFTPEEEEEVRRENQWALE